MLWPLARPICATHRCLEALERVIVVAERVDQLPCSEFLEQAHSQQLAEERPCLANAHISGIRLSFLPELEAVCDQAVQSATIVVLCANLLLERLDEELRDLRRAQLVPAQGCLAALDDSCAYGVGVVVYGDAV